MISANEAKCKTEKALDINGTLTQISDMICEAANKGEHILNYDGFPIGASKNNDRIHIATIIEHLKANGYNVNLYTPNVYFDKSLLENEFLQIAW